MAAKPRINRPPRPKSKRPVLRTNCPVCKAKVEIPDLSADPNFPFCSHRCKLIDLGKWLDGRYRISEHLRKDDV